MLKQIRMLLCAVLAMTVILGAVVGVSATEQETEQATEQAHEHEWDIASSDERTHTLTCKTCGTQQQEAHGFNGGSMCTVCGHYHRSHDLQYEPFNLGFHTETCTICGFSRKVTHTLDSTETCKFCGYKEFVHDHIWQYEGKYDDYNHHFDCTLCDSYYMEKHIIGSDGKCTVCGQPPHHEHQWKWTGEQDPNYHHVMGCDCGETRKEAHQYLWDGKPTDYMFHGVVCTVCGNRIAHVTHFFDVDFANGEMCLACGYEKVKHPWKYTGFSYEEGHDMFCADCDTYRLETHRTNGSGKCVVCGYVVSTSTQPQIKPSEPAESKPAGTEPTVSQPAVTEPSETEPTETEPTEMEPTETESTEMTVAQTQPVGTEPAVSEPVSENTAKEDTAHSGNQWIWWAAAILAVVSIIGTVVFLRKKK